MSIKSNNNISQLHQIPSCLSEFLSVPFSSSQMSILLQAAMPRLIVGFGCPWIARRKRSNNLLPILLQRCVSLDYADRVAPRWATCALPMRRTRCATTRWCHTPRSHSSLTTAGLARGGGTPTSPQYRWLVPPCVVHYFFCTLFRI